MTELKKKLTVKEFLMCLEGVEEMQDADWTPTTTQWRRIRDKINDIDDKAEAVREREPEDNRPRRDYAPAAPVYAESGLLPNPGADLANKPFLPDSPIVPAKTPTIDTSGGKYGSPFA
jgi:hypothetical protein